MSLHLNFEPHSWHKGWAIKHNRTQGHDNSYLERKMSNDEGYAWSAYTANGMTGYIEELHADTLKELKESINTRIDTLAERDRYNRQRLGEVMS